jgi:nucleotide-binding universal stress UspA family protein
LPRYLEREEIDAAGQRLREKVLGLVDSIPHPGISVEVDTFSLAPASQAILDISYLLEPDLICVGTSGHSAWHRMVLGSTATRVLHEARFPVLVVPHTPVEGFDGRG